MSPPKVLALNEKARAQSLTGPAIQETVNIAVLAPRLPPGMGEADGQGAADVISWNAGLNSQHNRPLPKGDDRLSSKKKVLKKAGLTTERKKAHEDMPPFRMRTVPYEIWRKHYAKDKDGNYMGTHAPAEDCLLKPEDMEKWSAEEPETYADTYTRGRRALPGYGDVEDGQLSAPPPFETGGAEEDHAGEAAPMRQGSSGRTIDGRTTEQIIAEAQAKEANKPKRSWRELIS